MIDDSSTEQKFIQNDIIFNRYLSDVDAQHADWALSLGYMITDQWSVFAGYKSGDTEWDQSSQTTSLSSEIPVLVRDENLNGKFEQDGPFIGTSYSFLVGSGVINFKAAYAYLSGEYQTNYSQFNYPFNGRGSKTDAFDRINLDGDSNAFSIGVSWTQSLADNLGYSIGANYHSYEFDVSGTSSRIGTGVSNYTADIKSGTLTEELFTLTVSLIYTF